MSLQNLFVAKLPRNLTDNDLLQIFAPYSPSSAKVMLDATTGRSKGFGFVLFDNVEKGEKAYKALNRKSTRACGHNFTLAIYPSNHDGKIATEASKSLYIRNIPITVPQEKVENFLRTFGNLTYCAMREDHYGSPVWVVYAEYENVEDAKNALTKLHGNHSYFHGSAPILAKFEDTDDAKKDRRRRREGTGNSNAVLSSGCIFPPPRPGSHSEGASAPSSAQTENANRGANNGKAVHGVLPAGMTTSTTLGATPSMLDSWEMPHSAPVVNGSAQYFYPKGGLQPSNGSNSAAVPFLAAKASLDSMSSAGGPGMSRSTATLQQAYAASLRAQQQPQQQLQQQQQQQHAQQAYPTVGTPNPQLLHPTPGFCYTLSGSGQHIFIPATTISQPSEHSLPQQHANGSAVVDGTGSAPAGNGAGAYSFPHSHASGSAGAAEAPSSDFQLLNPLSVNPVVLVDGSHSFILSTDTMNMPATASSAGPASVAALTPTDPQGTAFPYGQTGRQEVAQVPFQATPQAPSASATPFLMPHSNPQVHHPAANEVPMFPQATASIHGSPDAPSTLPTHPTIAHGAAADYVNNGEALNTFNGNGFKTMSAPSVGVPAQSAHFASRTLLTPGAKDAESGFPIGARGFLFDTTSAGFASA